MKRILLILAQVCLVVLVSGNIVRAQNHTQTVSVSNSPANITADGNYNQILLRENSATPTAVFSITLAGSSTALNYPAGAQFLFSGNFVNGQVIGTIVATAGGPFTFIAVEASGPPSMSVKNTIINSSGGSMVYPGAGVPLSTGSAWGTSYTVGSAANNLVQLNGSAQILSSMIPNPSASTLGGVESLTVVSHNFMTGISTSGVPSQAQPAFTDISGTLTNSQLPTSGVTAGSYTISSITVNAQGVITAASSGSGSSFTVQTNGTNNASSSALNFLTSTTNSDGLTITPSNPSSTGEKLEITGNYTGPYSSLSGLPQLAVTISAVSHNFLTSYTSSTGLFTQAQPAFSDISGSVAASQLPNPSASTLGGIESLASTSHQWINAISTSGVPSSTQPAYSDISGTPTATSVALTMPSWFSVAGSPVAPNGTLAVTAAIGQTSHQVIGTCGSATSFAPCALVSGDLPTVAIAQGGTNATSAASALINLFPAASEVGDIVYCSAYSSGCTAWSILAGNTSGTKVLQETSSGVPSWVANGGGVSSVTGDGTIITNSVSTGAVTLTIAGTSGGIPYFSSTSGWASSALLTHYGVLYGGGAAGAPVSTAAGTAGVPLKGSGSSAAPSFQSDNTCASTSTSDQITAAGAFATTCSVPATNLAVGTVIEVYIHGVWTTTATSSPKLNFEVNAGGTTGLCPAATTAVALTASQTNGIFDGTCRIVIVTTGSSGTAIAGGFIQTENGAGAGGIPPEGFNNPSTVVYNTTVSETVSVQETTAMVSGQTMNLQSLIVRVTP